MYGVKVLSVRSYVEQQPITRMTRDGKAIGPWRRPKSIKRMTVELEEPFVWPEEPKDLSKYVFFFFCFHCFLLHYERIPEKNQKQKKKKQQESLTKIMKRWEKESWDATQKYQHEVQKPKHGSTDYAEEPDEKLRKVYAEQAKDLLEGGQPWRPTWQALGLEYPRGQSFKTMRWRPFKEVKQKKDKKVTLPVSEEENVEQAGSSDNHEPVPTPTPPQEK